MGPDSIYFIFGILVLLLQVIFVLLTLLNVFWNPMSSVLQVNLERSGREASC